MPTDIRQWIKHVIVVLMENRSFDHMLGYLSLPPWSRSRQPVDGVKADPAWLARYANYLHGVPSPPHQFTDRVIDDPPHTRAAIHVQLGTSSGAAGPMTGFVQSYALRGEEPRDLSHVMGYYTAPDVPICDFFARNFAVCDRWFAPLPTGTQPNRLMALAGISPIEDNAGLYLPDQDLVYDWLTARNVSWRVYHDGIVPFIGLMRKWMDTIGDDDHKVDVADQPRFRWFDYFEADVKNTAVELPQVIFIEPDYTDIPFFHSAPPNDDHPPSSIDEGQRFLRRVYQTVTSNQDLWRHAAMIVTYDEHGGFFDHVEPLAIPTPSPAGEYEPFPAVGIRVPAFIVSPYVEAGSIVSINLDHTSILKFLAELFDPAGTYSPEVETRLRGTPGLGRLSQALTRDDPRADTPSAPDVTAATERPENVVAFHEAVAAVRARSPEHPTRYFGVDPGIQSP